MTSNFPSRYQGVPIHHCVIKGLPLWPLISHNVRDPNFPQFPPSRHQRDPNFQNTPWDIYRIKSAIFKSYNRDKRVQSMSRVVCGGGAKGTRLWSIGRGPGGSVVHGPQMSSLPHCPKGHYSERFLTWRIVILKQWPFGIKIFGIMTLWDKKIWNNDPSR